MGRKDILPVCIKAGALADNVPARDLWISPHHAMYFEDASGGMLIEAKDLVNGVSIVQAERVDKVEYFHIELDTHDVILAEGAPSETYPRRRQPLHVPQCARIRHALCRATSGSRHRYCAPRLEDGYEVEDVRRRIVARAGAGSSAGSRRYRVNVYRRTARR